MDYKKNILIMFILAFFVLSDIAILSTATRPLSIVNTSLIHTYIVHVEHPKGDLLSDEQREDFYRSFLPNITLDSGEPRLVYSYDVVMTGFAARLTSEEVAIMKSKDGFVHAHRENIYTLQTTYTPELLGLNQGMGLWNESNYGEGIVIAVIDSGITPTHPSFTDDGTMPSPPPKWRGRCGFKTDICNNKLVGAVSFLGGKSPEPYDINGHGTHVAGIAAGNPVYDASVLGLARGTATGMAPRAHLAIYKGCDDDGTCPESNIIKSIIQADKDGAAVVNMSFGRREDSLAETSAQGTFAVMKHGNIVSIAAATNSGPSKSRISHTAPWILTVGAATTDRRATCVVRLGNGMVLEGQSGYQPNPSNLTAMLPIVYPGVQKTQDTLTCQNGSMDSFDVKGKMVLCGTGGKNDDLPDKGKVVKASGGAAVVILSQPREGYTIGSDPHVIPACHLSYVDSMQILKYIQTGKNSTGIIEFKGTNFGARPSPTVASFSARGPSLVNGGILKPDVIAPGVNILSAWPDKVGPNCISSEKFASGTSMAVPHVTGITAMLKKNHPQWSSAAIKSALMTTAHRKDQDGKLFADDADTKFRPASVFAVGAGHVNPTAANDPGLIYDIGPDDYIPYLCGLKHLSDVQVSLIVGKRVHCCLVNQISADQLNYPSISVSITGSRSSTGKVTVNRTVTNVGEANSVYTVKPNEPKGVAVSVTPTTIQFSDLDQKESFSVELSITGAPPGKSDAWEGELLWVSSDGKYAVRSPLVVSA